MTRDEHDNRYIHQALVADGSLILSIDSRLRYLAAEWMPSLPESSANSHPRGPSIQVDDAEIDRPDLEYSPALALGSVQAWVDEAHDTVWLEDASGRIKSAIDRASRVARVCIRKDDDIAARDVTSLLTIAVALLLIRTARTPIHSAGVVHPESGRTYLLVGDSHSGKSTTTANLVKAGWSYLSDDYVVLSRDPVSKGITVEGWPGDFHLDEGWHRGESTGVRETVPEEDVAFGRRLTSAPLAGLLFPRVDASASTRVDPVSATVSLERLIRQTPWLIADQRKAAEVFNLLKDAVGSSNFDLTLGRDSLNDPQLLDKVVRSGAQTR